MNYDQESKNVAFLWVLTIVLVIYLWNQNSVLKQRVDACWQEIGIANDSIAYADDAMQSAREKAGGTYQAMEDALNSLDGTYEQRPNPCDKNFPESQLHGYGKQ